ncbi:hypothetical protein, partial [Streptobacillus moniliformis]|uniref:hypothetical protein n=1 Tax=Streptobacillus moniliformis TaxID=34105 RepID=UPI0018C8A74F
SYHVVIGANNATLDGVTISDGMADGGGTNSSGGGMYNLNSSPTLSHGVFASNTAIGAANGGNGSGGGMFNSNSNPGLTDVVFRQNSAFGASGAPGMSD